MSSGIIPRLCLSLTPGPLSFCMSEYRRWLPGIYCCLPIKQEKQMFGLSGLVWQGPKQITDPGFLLSGGIHLLFSARLETRPKWLPPSHVFAIIRSAAKERRKQIPGGVCSYLIRSVFREGKPLQRAEVCFAHVCLHFPQTHTHTQLRQYMHHRSLKDGWWWRTDVYAATDVGISNFDWLFSCGLRVVWEPW